MKTIFFCVLLFSNGLLSIAQHSTCPKSTNNKAIKLFADATAAFKAKHSDDALTAISQVLDADPEFADAYLLQGKIALKKKDDKTMEESFRKVIELCPDLDPEPYYQLASLYFYLKKYKETEENCKAYLNFDKVDEGKAKIAENMMVKSKLITHPVPFNPMPVKDLSTADPEYLPYISPDNEICFFTRRFEMKERNMLTTQNVEKFMMSRLRPDGTYEQGKPMPDPFNRTISNNEGGASITIDNKHLYFTVNSKGNFDICTSDFVEGKWTAIKNLGPNINDPKQWDAQPSISSDGRTLYFASARDSVTGIDIYKSTKDENGEWEKAVKLSSVINTNGNEKSPFIHSDSHTLYFSSDSLPGMGGFDIYRIHMDDKGNWEKPVNLGYPINTEADEVGFFVSTDGHTGYFSSNKLLNGGGSGSGYDIYSFDLYPEARPDKVYFQKGDLNGTNNDIPVSASIEVKDAISKKLTKIDVDSVSGEYAFVVNFDHDLLVTVKKEGYAFESEYVSINDSDNLKVITKDISLKKLEVGGQYTINDILFATNSYELNDTIKVVLDEFAEYLKDNPGLKVAIQGHTDNVGNPAENIVLSENRAKTVFDYLLSRSIEKSRMSYKGFGETKPIASNTTELGRAKNRRTVFVVNSK